MSKLIIIMMYALWTITLIGILAITFTSFRYTDLNIIVLVLATLTLINTYITIKTK
ncbi:MAG: hypothetical protein PHY73_01020 [Candidatus Omnitrophica bacterium]|nr:hypothetical protein [Candidatus Omnitrophota bacterium]